HWKMSRLYESFENSKYNYGSLQRIPLPDSIWILIDTLLMIMETAVVFLLITFV
ncbi:unnamed protein product, partial [Trichobilharzia szidati]